MLAQQTDIGGEQLGILQLGMCASSAFDHETAVETYQHFYPFVGEQVITDANDERTDEIAATQQFRQPGCIHDDVAMVGHEKRTVFDIRFYLFAVIEVVQFHTLRRPYLPNP